jgi:acyl-CoA reductase-like NAD-dependent aldehyde dehydrogenase
MADVVRTAAREVELRDPGRLDEVVGTVWFASAQEVEETVGAAASAQRKWSASGVEMRAEALLACAEAFEAADHEALARTLTSENGSILSVSRRELGMVARMLRYAVMHARQAVETPWPVGVGLTIRRRAYGVVACIVPWNAPVVLAMQKLAPALIAGNAVVVKPSPNSPLAVTQVLRTLADLLPVGVLGVVNGEADVGRGLVAHPDIRKVSFTGGNDAGRAVLALASQSFTRVHLELGGNDPAIILDDADVDSVAGSIIEQAFRRSGQVCFAIKRVYVPRHQMGRFAEAAVAAADEIAVGHGLDPRSTMGPVNNADQFRRLRAVQARLEEDGSRIAYAGSRVDPSLWESGHYLRPAVVLDAAPDDEIVLEEQFGPILPLVPYDSEDQAIAFANGTEFGLCSSVWSADPERASILAERIEAGITFVNGHSLSESGQRDLPFGGMKQSGMGWENSPAGLDEFLEYHSIHMGARG